MRKTLARSSAALIAWLFEATARTPLSGHLSPIVIMAVQRARSYGPLRLRLGLCGARYAFGAIDHLVQQLEGHDAQWRRWFAAHGRAPHEVSYDDLAADPPGTIGAVLRALGLPDDRVPAPATQRQGDGRSREWADRYRSERESAA